MNWDAIKPFAAQGARDFLRTVGMGLAAHGVIKDGAGVEAFIGAGMTLAGIFWGWFTTSGYLQVAGLLKKLTATATPKDAVKAAQVLPTAAAVDTSSKAAVAKSVTSAIICAIALSMLMLAFSPAMAQTAPKKQTGAVLTGDLVKDAKNGFHGDPNDPNAVQLTGDIKKDAQALWDKLVAASTADLQYASQLAANADTPSSGVRKQCWDAIIAINQQANGLNLKDAQGNLLPQPDPKLFTQIEQSAEVLDALSPQGKLFTSCAGAAQLAQTGVIQFVTAAISGVSGIAKLAPIPGLIP